ncbi:MAG: Lrp/AsnC family transcriptional regulator [Chitinispirillaceae bacterium]|nr:Lrp/AsnC family transcriptional regulator [Chitinispirillaceae bacterium]
MTRLERTLLNTIQKEFPLEPRPFLALASAIGVTERECIVTLQRLLDQGILRKIGPVWNWQALGYKTVLIGMRVSPACIDALARRINRCAGVTHNYRRKGRLNLWFTCIYRAVREIDDLLGSLQKMHGVVEVKKFHAEKTYKIGLVLEL